MNEIISSFLDNDSFFGKFMTKLGIIIVANFCFLLSMLPIVTTGPGICAMYHVMFKTLKDHDTVNPFKDFWHGFKENFKQGVISWIIFLFLIVFLSVDLSIINQSNGALEPLRIVVYAIAVLVVILFVFLYINMAAFSDTIINLFRNAVFFAIKKPFRSLVVLFFELFPLYLTFTDPTMRPLYAFIWATFGFGAIAMLGATLFFAPFKEYQKG